MKRLLITAGGTGGHIFPAVSIANRCQQEAIETLFVGGRLLKNSYFDSKNHNCRSISCATFSLKRPWRIPFALMSIFMGFLQSLKIIKEYRPELIVGFGSFYTLPTLLAAKWSGTPYILHEANSIPGKVNRMFSRGAETTAVHFPTTTLKGNLTEAGMPLRFHRGEVSRQQALEYYGFRDDLPTLLIFGGSQGANSLNCVVRTKTPFQVIHLTGHHAYSLAGKYVENGISAVVKEFETEMAYAWELADCVICRAGAGTVAEIIEYEVPALLIPFPRATDNHQVGNACFVRDQVGGGLVLLESQLTELSFEKNIEQLISNRAHFKESIQNYKKNHSQPDLIDIIKQRLKKYE